MSVLEELRIVQGLLRGMFVLAAEHLQVERETVCEHRLTPLLQLDDDGI